MWQSDTARRYFMYWYVLVRGVSAFFVSTCVFLFTVSGALLLMDALPYYLFRNAGIGGTLFDNMVLIATLVGLLVGIAGVILVTAWHVWLAIQHINNRDPFWPIRPPPDDD